MSGQFNRLTKVLARSFDLDEKTIVSCLRLARSTDIDTVSSLRRRVFGAEISPDDEQYLKWRYLDREGYDSTLWVFEYNHQVIAAIGTEPVDIWNEGKLQSAVRNMDAIVEPKYISRGLGAWMTLAMQSQHDCVLVTGGNENSTSMLKKLFTSLTVKKNYKIILHSYHFLSNKISSHLIVTFLSPPVDLVLLLVLQFKWLFITKPESWKIDSFSDVHELLPYIDDRPGVLGNVKVLRSKEYLKWRYADNPCTHFRAIAIFEQNELLAYLIYTYDMKQQDKSLSKAYIMDWNVFSSLEKMKILKVLFKATIKELKIEVVDEIFIMLNDHDSGLAARSSGFFKRYEDPTFFVYNKNLAETDRFFTAQAWYHSLGDSDTI